MNGDDGEPLVIDAASRSRFAHVGVLMKLGFKRKNWKNRIFALDAERREVFYFRTRRAFDLFAVNRKQYAGELAGAIMLIKAQVYKVDFLDEFKDKSCFGISAPGRHFFMYCASEEDFAGWMRALSTCGLQFLCDRPGQRWTEFLDRAGGSVIVRSKVGYMWKRGDWNPAFQRRFFRVGTDGASNAFSLAYYARYDDVEPRGTIPLQANRVVGQAEGPEAQESDAKLIFYIVTPARMYVLRAESEADKQTWVEVLQLLSRVPLNSPTPTLPMPSIPLPAPTGEKKEAEVDDDGDTEPEAEAEHEERRAAAAAAAAASAGGSSRANGGDEASAERVAERQRAAAALFQKAQHDKVAAQAHAAAAASAASGGATESKEEVAMRIRKAHDRNQVMRLSARSPSTSAIPAAAPAPAPVPAPSPSPGEQHRALLLAGHVFVKHGRQGNPHRKRVYGLGAPLGEPVRVLCWSDSVDASGASKSISLTETTRITRGKETPVLTRSTSSKVDAELCLSVITDDRSLDLQAESRSVRDLWADALEFMVKQITFADCPPLVYK